MSEEFQKYEQLIRVEDELVYKIETYQEAISALLMLIHKRGASDLHLLHRRNLIDNTFSRSNLSH